MFIVTTDVLPLLISLRRIIRMGSIILSDNNYVINVFRLAVFDYLLGNFTILFIIVLFKEGPDIIRVSVLFYFLV